MDFQNIQKNKFLKNVNIIEKFFLLLLILTGKKILKIIKTIRLSFLKERKE